MKTINVPEDICEMIENSFNQKVENFEVIVHDGNKKGEGFLGEMLYVSLAHKTSKENHHLVVKQVLPCTKKTTEEFMSSVYSNEIHFYKKIAPCMLDFQKSFPKAEALDITAKYYGSHTEVGKEKIILENLKFSNYEVHPKVIPLEEKMFQLIFKNYAKYHALSFALKEHEPEKFLELVKPLQNIWLKIDVSGIFTKLLRDGCEKVQVLLEDNGEEKILKTFQKYMDNAYDIFEEKAQYDGPYKIITHGDSWSNNMMFKYNASKEVIDMKLIDFQLSCFGTPMHDLTYSFYSGANKKSLDNLEQLLQFYHKNLSYYLKQYDLDVDKIYPYEEMKKEWKKYTPFGLLVGILIWQNKYSPDDAIIAVNDLMDEDNDENVGMKVIREKFDPPVLNLMRHLYENNFL